MLINEIRCPLLEDADVLDCLIGKSDHRVVYASLKIPSGDSTATRRKRIHIGWHPSVNVNGEPETYHAALDQAIARQGDECEDPT